MRSRQNHCCTKSVLFNVQAPQTIYIEVILLSVKVTPTSLGLFGKLGHFLKSNLPVMLLVPVHQVISANQRMQGNKGRKDVSLADPLHFCSGPIFVSVECKRGLNFKNQINVAYLQFLRFQPCFQMFVNNSG